MDSVDTKITLHSDGKILIEGKGGIMIDAASSKLELKGSEVSITATSGVKIDGGNGAVNAHQHRRGRRSREPPRSSRAARRPRSRPAVC